METALRSAGRRRKQEREDSVQSSFQHHAPLGQRPDELALTVKPHMPCWGESRSSTDCYPGGKGLQNKNESTNKSHRLSGPEAKGILEV